MESWKKIVKLGPFLFGTYSNNNSQEKSKQNFDGANPNRHFEKLLIDFASLRRGRSVAIAEWSLGLFLKFVSMFWIRNQKS